MNKIKKIILMTSLVLIAVGVVGGTLAFLLDVTDPVTNIFEPTYVPIEVIEPDFDGKTKTNVTIQNNGNIPAYIRATYVVNWADKDGNIWGTPPTTEQYTIELGENWKRNSENEDDHYYYYTSVVAANGEDGDKTTDFIVKCSLNQDVTPPKDTDGNEYYLCVDILAQSVQSEPNDAVLALWGIIPTTLKN